MEDFGFGTVMVGARKLAAIEDPVDGLAKIRGELVACYAIWAYARVSISRAHATVASAYKAELLTANRRTQQARTALRRAELLIERERQKRRRETNRAVARPSRQRALVDMRERTARREERAGIPLD